MVGVYEIGRVCVKTTGREAGSYCAVVNIIDKNYALVDGPKVRRRRVNFKHLEPIDAKLEIKKDASKEDVVAAADRAGLSEKLAEKVKLTAF